MAKVIGPLHSTEARGVIGGLIYNTWRGIRTVKRMTSPCQPRTARSLKIRALTIRLVRYWQTLETAERASWNDYAAAHPVLDWTGIAKRLTGCNWFVGLNLRRLELYPDPVDTPPIVAAPLPANNFQLVGSAVTLTATWTPTAGNMLVAQIFLLGPHSAGKQGKIEQAKLLSYTTGEEGTKVVTPLLPGTYTMFVRIMSEDDGQVSTWVSASAVVTAA